nr:transposase [Pedosphaera parvula]
MASFAPACFSPQAWARARRHLLSHLVCFGRHTITGLLRLQDRTQADWTADYRLYAEAHFETDRLFGAIRAQVQEQLAPDAPLMVAMDDSLLRKTGHKVYGGRHLRDPLSPAFHVNFVRGLRILQISAAVPAAGGTARLIPIDFQHAALPPKPRRNAPASAHEAYEQERAKKNLNLVGRERLAFLRQQMDQSGASHRRLMVSLDGRFTNSTVLKGVPERTTLIGRVRKDSVFFHPPEEQPGHGRKRKYGPRCPTPEELLKDEAVPWQPVEAQAGRHPFEVKTLAPVYTQMDRAQKPLRLVVVKPVRYHLTKTKTDRRKPAFFLCTDPDLPLEKVLQYDLWRWDIEVNFRDEKTILGVGQAQVRTEASNQNAPALAVAAYAVLLLAALKAYGMEGKPESFQSPRWDKRKAKRRASTNDLRNQLRYELWASAVRPHFQPLSSRPSPEQNGRKYDLPLQSALFSSIR